MIEVDENLVEKIMSTLPPKALMRFKCASKRWYSLINNPRFVAKHLSSYNYNSKHLLVMKRLISKDTTNNTEEEEEENKKEDELVFSLLNLCNNDSIDNGEDRIIVSSVEDIKIPLFSTWGDDPPDVIWGDDVSHSTDVQGFGYDAKLNEYKVVNIGLSYASNWRDEGYDIHNRAKAAIYSLSTDSWTKINTNALETETTVFRLESFQIQFKQMLYWLGHEQHKELNVLDAYEDLIRQVIILLDIQNEVFHNIMLPDSFDRPNVALRVWNESLALFVLVDDYKPEREYSFEIWVLDELGGPKGAWKKHITLEPTPKPFALLNSNEIFLNDFTGLNFMGLVLSYDLGSERLKDTLFHNTPCSTSDDIVAVVYVNSIASVLGDHKLERRDNFSVANFSPLTDSLSSPSIMDLEWNSYSIWAIPTAEVSLRIKKVMEGLKTEFGGPEIEPHIPVVGSIRMTDEDVLDKFRSLCSKNFHAYQAKVNLVVTTNFYHQCVSLLIDTSPEAYSQLDYTTGISNGHFGFHANGRPYLSLLYGNLTEEEKRKAVEKVSILDESIASLSFTIAKLALYKIKYKDTTLKYWEKIADYTLPLPP
ncbi:PREDICTED: uncharacterized protein LOC101295378 [Fragaria vesca subsp. vesca]